MKGAATRPSQEIFARIFLMLKNTQEKFDGEKFFTIPGGSTCRLNSSGDRRPGRVQPLPICNMLDELFDVHTHAAVDLRTCLCNYSASRFSTKLSQLAL